MNKVYQIITDEILKALDQGVVPWKQLWSSMTPTSASTGKPYTGINCFLLSMSQSRNGFKSNLWMTYKQATKLGGNVKKGEKSTIVVYWQINEKKDENGKKKNIPFLRYYRVFNFDQTENVTLPKRLEEKNVKVNDNDIIDNAENVVQNMPNAPVISVGGDVASYVPSMDMVTMPDITIFTISEEYYSVLFHELVHSTGHKSRLDRSGKMDKENYSKEELIAEMGSAFLCGYCGISESTIDQSAAYIDHWRKVIEGDPKVVIQAASKAQKAADYILGKNNDFKVENEE